MTAKDRDVPRVEAVLTKGAIGMHAAVIASVGAVLIWLGQNVFFTRNEAEALAQHVKATSEQVKEISTVLRGLQGEQDRIVIALGGLQERQTLVVEILGDIKEELKALQNERRP